MTVLVSTQTGRSLRAPARSWTTLAEVDYVPLTDGYNWKGDPNATLSGQPIPQLPPGTPESAPTSATVPPAAMPPRIAIAQYDPNTGTYVGPDGRSYRQTDLARDADQHQSWQDMMLPPKG